MEDWIYTYYRNNCKGKPLGKTKFASVLGYATLSHYKRKIHEDLVGKTKLKETILEKIGALVSLSPEFFEKLIPYVNAPELDLLEDLAYRAKLMTRKSSFKKIKTSKPALKAYIYALNLYKHNSYKGGRPPAVVEGAYLAYYKKFHEEFKKQGDDIKVTTYFAVYKETGELPDEDLVEFVGLLHKAMDVNKFLLRRDSGFVKYLFSKADLIGVDEIYKTVARLCRSYGDSKDDYEVVAKYHPEASPEMKLFSFYTGKCVFGKEDSHRDNYFGLHHSFMEGKRSPALQDIMAIEHSQVAPVLVTRLYNIMGQDRFNDEEVETLIEFLGMNPEYSEHIANLAETINVHRDKSVSTIYSPYTAVYLFNHLGFNDRSQTELFNTTLSRCPDINYPELVFEQAERVNRVSNLTTRPSLFRNSFIKAFKAMSPEKLSSLSRTDLFNSFVLLAHFGDFNLAKQLGDYLNKEDQEYLGLLDKSINQMIFGYSDVESTTKTNWISKLYQAMDNVIGRVVRNVSPAEFYNRDAHRVYAECLVAGLVNKQIEFYEESERFTGEELDRAPRDYNRIKWYAGKFSNLVRAYFGNLKNTHSLDQADALFHYLDKKMDLEAESADSSRYRSLWDEKSKTLFFIGESNFEQILENGIRLTPEYVVFIDPQDKYDYKTGTDDWEFKKSILKINKVFWKAAQLMARLRTRVLHGHDNSGSFYNIARRDCPEVRLLGKTYKAGKPL